jgi:hypothetical protein
MAYQSTIFNQLSNLLLGRGATPSDLAAAGGNAPSTTPQILKANSVEERDEMVLSTQQQNYFRTQLLSLMQADTHKRVYFEGTRLQQYQDYEAMEEYPDIARALDLLAEEATMSSIKGQALNVYSDNHRVKSVLTDFFTNTLDVPTVLPFWARIMIKQGNCFLYHPVAEGKGITGARLLSTIDTERHELIVDDQPLTKFRHTMVTGGIQEYSIWQVSHFRMLGNERHLPYGTSLLYRIRRTYKMLMMAKDAVLVYRLTRAPERRVHKVYTGNIDPNDVPEYLQAVADSHKKAKLIDPKTGDFNFAYQPATMDMDYYVGVSAEGTGTQIDTLPGASNLDALGDLNMLEDDLFGGLGVPKSFVKFNSSSGGSSGDGKSFSMLDLRLARQVSRIQQALLAELTRMAMVHLFLLGGDFHQELTNFTLTLNSPSVQLQLMHEELRAAQLDNYVKATTPSGEGVAAMSASKAMKEILGMSEEEVIQNFKDQFMESKIYTEIKSAGELLPTSGLYDDIIRFAQAGKAKPTSQGAPEQDGAPGGPPPGGGGFGGPGPDGALPGGAPGPDGAPAPGPDGAPGGPGPGAGAGPGPGSLNEQTLRAGERLLAISKLLGD